jgi:hypothetical protein
MPGIYKSKWAVYLGVTALVIALMVAWPHYGSRRGTGASPMGNPPVGTAGHETAPGPEDSPATVHDLDTVLRTVDQNELIGRRIDFHVKVADVNNYTSFWVGNKDNRMLVVLARDNRTDAQRDRGAPSTNGIQPVNAGQTARITGTIEGIPHAEARYSWGINDSVRRALKDQKVYIRADTIAPEG